MHKLELEYIKYDENMSSRERRLHEHNVAYALLFRMLKEVFSISCPAVKRTENGKPYVENEGVFFSISHTQGLAVCVVADRAVGVDCERITKRKREDTEKFAKRFFVENEIDLLQNEGYSAPAFYKIWTGKEATLKRRGTNMSDLKNIDITKENLHFSFENDYIITINI